MEKSAADSPHGRVKCTKVLVVLDPDEADVQRDLLRSSWKAIPEDTRISKLPPEVLQKVFNFLSLEDRKNASLVCTKWSEVANTNTFRKNEKLVFHGHQNWEQSLSSLSNTKRNYLNLEFHDCDFPMSSNLLSLTEKIRCLSFRNCTLCVPFQIELFLKCDRLNEFYYKNTDDFDCPVAFRFYNETIESLVERQFVNRNLESLQVYMIQNRQLESWEDYLDKRENMTEKNIESLFHMFPNIKHLTFRLYDERLLVSYTPTLAPMILSKKHELESLKITLYENLRLLAPHSFTRLKKISLRIDDTDELPFLLSSLIGRLHCLEEISLKIFDACERPIAVFPNAVCDLISSSLERCKRLKHLKLYYDCQVPFDVPLDPQTFRALVSSNLISFQTNIMFFLSPALNSDQVFTLDSTNKTMRILRILKIGDHRVLTLFIRWFENLKFLELPCYFAEVNEGISRFQKNVTILKLTLFRSDFEIMEFCNGDRSSGLRQWNSEDLKCCLHSLPSLKNLDLTWKDDRPFHYEIICPGLKSLRLHFVGETKVTESGLSHLKKLIELEAIHIKSNNASTTDLRVWTEICNSLKKLRLLSLESRGNDDLLLTSDTYPFSEAHQHLFESCPSLRWLVQKTQKSFQIFRFDQIDKRMEKLKWFSDWDRNLGMSKTSLVRRLNSFFFK